MLRAIIFVVLLMTVYIAGAFSLKQNLEVKAFKPPQTKPEAKGGKTLNELPPGVKPADPEMKPEGTTPGVAEAPQNPLDLEKTWRVVHDYRQFKGSFPLTEKTPAYTLLDFKFDGPQNKDPNQLHDYEVDGVWGIEKGLLTRTDGKNAALKIGRGENFELEGLISADGVGGWFIFVGHDQGHGYCIYNVTLKVSGSPFFVCEFRGNKGLEDTHKEINRYSCNPSELMWLSVVNKKLNLKMGKTPVIEDQPLPNYHNGDIIIGTYECQYGPKNLKIHTLRVKAK